MVILTCFFIAEFDVGNEIVEFTYRKGLSRRIGVHFIGNEWNSRCFVGNPKEIGHILRDFIIGPAIGKQCDAKGR
jgi:hypothetical protein